MAYGENNGYFQQNFLVTEESNLLFVCLGLLSNQLLYKTYILRETESSQDAICESAQFSTCYDTINRFRRVKAKSLFLILSKIKTHLKENTQRSCLTKGFLSAKVETI